MKKIILVSIAILTVSYSLLNRKCCLTNPDQNATQVLENSRFGPIRVLGRNNRSGVLIINFQDEVLTESTQAVDKNYIESLVAKGTVVAQVNLAKYLELSKGQDMGPETPCFKYAGEISRLSQVLQNTLKMDKVSKVIFLSTGQKSSVFSLLVHRYLKEDYYGSFALELPETSFSEFGICSISESQDKHLELTPLEILSNVKHKSEYLNFRAKLLSENSGVNKNSNLVSSEFLICNDYSCPLLDTFIPANTKQDKDLPLIEIIPKQIKTDYFILFLSGDGGWASIDKEIGSYLSDQGIPVVGFNTLKYLWSKKNPDTLAVDISKVLEKYQASFKLNKVVLIGFSLGANMVPFILTRLPEEQLNAISYYSMLSPSVKTEFEVHFSDWIPGNLPSEGLNILPELNKSQSIPASCIKGIEEELSLCDEKLPTWISVFNLKGTHHFDEDYEKVSSILLEELRKRAR